MIKLQAMKNGRYQAWMTQFSMRRFQLGILALLLLICLVSVYSSSPASEPSADYAAATQIASLESRLVNESSGIVASRRSKEILWTHNDSGDGAFLYAFDRQGKHRGVYKVTGAGAVDWEDMAAWRDGKSGKSYLYLGDIGNNSKKRDVLTIYRVLEPAVAGKDAATTRQTAVATSAAEAIRVKYPDANYDAETLMIHPTTGDLYIITKVLGGAARVFKLQAPFRERQTAAPEAAVLTQVGELQLPNAARGFLTGGDISPDGRRVALCDYFGAYELTLPAGQGDFDDIWRQPIKSVNIVSRKQGEAITYRADGLALLATSEGVPCPLIEIPQAGKPAQKP